MTHAGPRITIITAAYNPGREIEECFRSVQDQGYPNLQHIVIDGGSDDIPFSRITKHRDQISELVHERDNGISDAWNKGLRLADGDLIGLLNADDFLLPGTLRCIAEGYCKTAGRAILHGDVLRIENGKTFQRGSRFPVGLMIYAAIPVLHPATYLPKAVYDQIGLFDLSYGVAMDYDLMLRAWLAGWRFHRIHRPLVGFRAGGNSDRRALEGFADVVRSQRKHRLSPLLIEPLYVAKYIVRKYLRPAVGLK